MKKWLCTILAIMMVLSLAACGKQEAPAAQGAGEKVIDGLHIGFGKCKFEPEDGTPMGGYGNSESRLSTGDYGDPLHAICLAASDGKETVLIYAMDATSLNASWVSVARERVTKATGVPADRIFFSATHTHSAVDMTGTVYNGLNPKTQSASEKSFVAVETAAKQAMADLAPVNGVYGNHVQTEKMAYVRHYKLTDGSYAGDNFGSFSAAPIEDYALPADEQMVLLKFEREGAEDVLVLNFQVHPCYTGGIDQTILSADVPGGTRDYVEEQTGMKVIYYTGAAGNQNTETRIGRDDHGLDFYSYCARLGDYAISGLENMTKVEGSNDVAVNYNVFTGNIWHENEDKLPQAQEVEALFQSEGRDTATTLAIKYGFTSVYHARAVINHATKLGATQDMEMCAVRIGGVGMITAAFEMFSVTGTYIKTNSPYEFTAICSVAGPSYSYIPAKEAYEYGCYESYVAYYEAGTAETVAEKFVEMLSEIKPQ